MTNIVLCKQGADEVVKVGRKGSAFWIDRYEASVWEKEDGTGKQYGAMMDDYPQSFPKNGQVTTPLYAVSKAGVMPSAILTWFQANEACRASGKRLPLGDEWLAAARGTLDPGASDGSGGACITLAAGQRNTGAGSKCSSDWGAEDMVGNLWEWTTEWYAGLGKADSSARPWPSSYGDDATYNITSSATAPGVTMGLPAAAKRGGNFLGGTDSGIYALALNSSPADHSGDFGFRCVVPR